MSKALIVQGGWDGHEPVLVAQRFKEILEVEGFEVEVSDTLTSFDDAVALKSLDLIVPVWTMSEITKEQCKAVMDAVASGVGIAGCHGGMCDAFRQNTEWQFMTGAQWVSHPGGDGVEYMVNIKNSSSWLVEGIQDFKIVSEHYYLHIDPVVEVLASTTFPLVKWFHSPNGVVEMPVTYTKKWGHGRVFYTSLGHHADVFDVPQAAEMMRRGFLWAADSKRIAAENGLDAGEFESSAKMF